jgi:hypothetical protein
LRKTPPPRRSRSRLTLKTPSSRFSRREPQAACATRRIISRAWAFDRNLRDQSGSAAGNFWCPLATAVRNSPDTWFDCAAAAVFAAGVVAARHCRNPTSIDPLLSDYISGKSREPRQLACNLSVPHYRHSAETLSGAHGIAHSTQLDQDEHVACIDRTYRDCQICGRATPAQSPNGEIRAESGLMVVVSMAAGVASFGAGAAFMKLLIG